MCLKEGSNSMKESGASGGGFEVQMMTVNGVICSDRTD